MPKVLDKGDQRTGGLSGPRKGAEIVDPFWTSMGSTSIIMVNTQAYLLICVYGIFVQILKRCLLNSQNKSFYLKLHIKSVLTKVSLLPTHVSVFGSFLDLFQTSVPPWTSRSLGSVSSGSGDGQWVSIAKLVPSSCSHDSLLPCTPFALLWRTGMRAPPKAWAWQHWGPWP